MKSNNFKLLIIACLFLGLVACQNSSNKQTDQTDNLNVKPSAQSIQVNQSPTVDPPIKGIDVPYKTYSVDANKGGTITMENGSYIVVPPNAFTTEDGSPVAGKVKLEYREFHDAASIVASGIPMQNKGEDRYMETAGMFELKGADEAGKPVLINEEKSVEVNMASFVKGENFDFFYLDKKACKWDNKGTAKPTVNKAKKEILANLPVVPAQPKKPDGANQKDFVFDMNVNYENFPELKAFHGVVWQYNREGGTPDPEKNDWVFEEDWKEIDLTSVDQAKGIYSLNLKSFDKSFSTQVLPVLKGSNLEEALALFENKTREYKKIKKQRVEEAGRAKVQADLLRSFAVNKFGIYNWDIWKQPNRMILAADFDFGEDVNMDVYKPQVFLITESNRSVVKFTKETFSKFSFEPSSENKMLAVLPGNTLAVFGADDFKKMKMSELKAMDNPTYTFKMKDTQKKIESYKDFEKAMKDVVL